jgi:hypothetical protein
LTAEERRALDAAAARTGRSVSSLIRAAVDEMYSGGRSADDDLKSMRQAFGAWSGHVESGKDIVEGLRTGARLRHARR